MTKQSHAFAENKMITKDKETERKLLVYRDYKFPLHIDSGNEWGELWAWYDGTAQIKSQIRKLLDRAIERGQIPNIARPPRVLIH